MPQIQRLSQADAVALASKMRNKLRNQEAERMQLMTHLGRAGGALGGAYLMGSHMGKLELEYQANAVAIDEGEMADPRQLAGVDLEIWIGGGAMIAGLVGQGVLGTGKSGIAKTLSKVASVSEGAGLGILSGYLYTMGQTAAQEAPAEDAA